MYMLSMNTYPLHISLVNVLSLCTDCMLLIMLVLIPGLFI